MRKYNIGNMIFHIPVHIDDRRASTSNIRPIKLIEAFREIGYNVDVVEGYAAQRKDAIKKIKHKIREGVKYDFLYSESSTMPTLLTERHHIPTHPFVDFHFFSFCKKRGIPIGLFYRDIYWRFINRNKDFKQFVAKYFYQYDLYQYSRLLDVFFLPSYGMLKHIPIRFDGSVVEMPPGCDIHPASDHKYDGQLQLLYIGGIGGTYDLRNMIIGVAKCKFVNLTICCRPTDWQLVENSYKDLMADNIKIVHLRGEQLAKIYAQSDIFSMFYANEYMEFAAPYKLFDTLGYRLPILAPSNTWMGRFVNKNNIGIVCDYDVDAFCEALHQIVSNPSVLGQYRKNIENIIPANIWNARARQIMTTLMSIGKV